ncbi:hypothetical protein [Nocardioides speluncae]|uniref:hypothetical protein n=1 Tax=Nocardioides speluncae TaxID=2670337 RepID=UPI0012B16B27|nr:hypothetical protein [Nocardioides speluncae]
MTTSEVWMAIILLGLVLIGVGVALWLHARRQLAAAAAARQQTKHRRGDPETGRHALRDPNAALAGILSQVPPKGASGGAHRAE